VHADLRAPTSPCPCRTTARHDRVSDQVGEINAVEPWSVNGSRSCVGAAGASPCIRFTARSRHLLRCMSQHVARRRPFTRPQRSGPHLGGTATRPTGLTFPLGNDLTTHTAADQGIATAPLRWHEVGVDSVHGTFHAIRLADDRVAFRGNAAGFFGSRSFLRTDKSRKLRCGR
jgi:hypothetical protein